MRHIRHGPEPWPAVGARLKAAGAIAAPDLEIAIPIRIDVLGARPRVPYGVISTRHGKGALAGELPEGPPPDPEASLLDPNRWRTVSVFTEITGGFGAMPLGDGRVVRYPLAPFPGIVGVGVDTDESVSSIPPGSHGGNLDVRWFAAGSSVYLPVQLADAMVYAGDPHFAQGNGEVCVTGIECPLQFSLRFNVLKGRSLRRGASNSTPRPGRSSRSSTRRATS